MQGPCSVQASCSMARLPFHCRFAPVGLAAAYGYAAHLISTGDCTEGHALAAGTSAVLSVVMLRRSVGTPGWLNLPTIVSPIAVGDTAYEAMRAKQWYDAEQDDGEEDGSEHSGDRT